MQTTSFITISAAILFLPAAFGDIGTTYECTGATFSSRRELKNAQQVCINNLNKGVQMQNKVGGSRKDSKYHVVLTPHEGLKSPIKQKDKLEYIAEYQKSDCKLIHVFEIKMGIRKNCVQNLDQFSQGKIQGNLKSHEANRQNLIPCGDYVMELSYLNRAANSGCAALQRMQIGHHVPHLKKSLITKFPDSNKFYRSGTLYEWPFHPDGHLQKTDETPGRYRIIINSECSIVGFRVLRHLDGSIKKNELICTLIIPHADSNIRQKHIRR
ncbi:BgTH12-03793 [Blumeria graminis f. sp. triticale]|uniref:BgTH12-03793 n=1 Tax=Blumeria graminis f. sp. triticale TaxID=1689686 RepID=A0A9W4GDB9_BLUGR|nr:BgTH12-03793 [Blumeria graminis f. sp. triticale]